MHFIKSAIINISHHNLYKCMHLLKIKNNFSLPASLSALYLNEVSELAEGSLLMSFFGVCREDGQIPSINNRGGNHRLTSQLEVAQSQEDSWSYHIFQAGLSETAETAHLDKVQLPISQIKGWRRTCINGTDGQ